MLTTEAISKSILYTLKTFSHAEITERCQQAIKRAKLQGPEIALPSVQKLKQNNIRIQCAIPAETQKLRDMD